MSGRFVKPQSVRLPISNGDYVDVKRELTAGEAQDLFASMAPQMSPGEKVQLNSQVVMTARVLAYLLTWSLTDDGTPVPMSPEMPEAARLSTVRSLSQTTFREITEAINAHEEAIDKRVAELKNDQGTPSESVAT